MPTLNATELSAWRGFLDTHETLVRQLDAELVAEGLNLAAYDLLVRLQEAGPAGVRMTELARGLRFSGGGLTRLADRLESQGFIQRRRCPEDGRGFEAVLTRAGAAKLKRTHVKHLRTVRSRFLDRLTPDEIAALASIWSKFPLVFDDDRTRPSTQGANA